MGFIIHYYFSLQGVCHHAKLWEGEEGKMNQDLALSKLNKLGGETRLISMKLSLTLLLMESERSLSQEITT